jgi:hypothetical protein
MVQTTETLHTRAILVKLSLPTWSGKMDDKEVTKTTLDAHGASKGAGKFSKYLLPREASTERQLGEGEPENAFTALVAHLSDVRNWSYANTLPWSRDGWLLLPIANHSRYTTYIREAQHKYDELLARLVEDYRELILSARRCLGPKLSAGARYPSDIAAEFGFAIDYNPVPSGGDFRVSLTDEEKAILSKSTEERVKQTAEAAQNVATKRLYEVLQKIHETLSAANPNRKDGAKSFKDSLIENARDLCGVLGALNIADDVRLERFRRETELLAMSEPETIRENPAVRAEVAARAENILTEMTQAFGKGIFG